MMYRMGIDDDAALLEHSRHLRSTFDAIAGRAGRSDYLRVMSAAVANQHPDGSFGSNDDHAVKCCLTGEMIDVYLRTTPAPLRSRGQEASRTGYPNEQLSKARSWLINQQQGDGQWGEDLWDTCEVVKALLAMGLPDDIDAIEKALVLVRQAVDENWPMAPNYWTGPGQLGNALQVFGLAADSHYGNLVANQLLEQQDPGTGEFNGGVGIGRGPIEWHTACALMGLLSADMAACDPERIAHGIEWLKFAQSGDGSWCPGQTQLTCYITRNAVVALTMAEGSKSASAVLGTDYLVNRWCKSFPNPATSETLMAASCLAYTHHQDLYGSISFSLLTDTQQLLYTFESTLQKSQGAAEQLRQEKAILEQEVSAMKIQLAELPSRVLSMEDRLSLATQSSLDWQQRYGELNTKMSTYALRMTSNQLTVIGIVLAVFGIALTLILALA